MTPDRWQEVERIYQTALEREPAARMTLAHELCGDDLELRASVEWLLAQYAAEMEDTTVSRGGVPSNAPASLPEATGAEAEPVAAPAMSGSQRTPASVAAPAKVNGAKSVPAQSAPTPPASQAGQAPLAPAPGTPPAGGLAEGVPSRIGTYRLIEKIGEGGMGVVYLAEDERLQRRVALKLLQADRAGTGAGAQLIREARLVAGITHPLICQVFELGDCEGQPFVVMELLTGEALTARMARGDLRSGEAVAIATQVLDALTVLHEHGIIHRDLKPSNIFLTAQGVKLLDFGLARPLDRAAGDMVLATQAGTFLGTPQYAAPEQFTGDPLDARADLFAVGVILFEMLTGKPPFTGNTLHALIQAVLNEAPPVLTGSPAVAAADRVLCRALAKHPDQRYADAATFSADLKSIAVLVGDDQVIEAQRLLRLAVLPFVLLQPDPKFDYLGQSLAEALVIALSDLQSLVVRSSLKTAKYTTATPDLGVLATELAIDVVLTGSILRAGDRFRVTAQLVTVPDGNILWNDTMETSADLIFDLHDEVARRVVAALPLTTTDHERSPHRQPSNPKAYDLYLRGMQLRMESGSWKQARALFDKCLSLEATFAPAWAERGRLDRVLGKYHEPRLLREAEQALKQALVLDPDNGAAIHYLAQLDIDLGRLDEAIERLLARAAERRAEPHVYAALSHACRYAGLLDESLAAHHQARRLDPEVPTSVIHTYYMRGDFTRALEMAHECSDPMLARIYAALGRRDEAIAASKDEEERFAAFPVLRSFVAAMTATLEGRREDALAEMGVLSEWGFSDGEGLFYGAGMLTQVGALEEAKQSLVQCVDAGFLCLPAFEHDPLLEPLRTSGLVDEVIARVRTKQPAVVATFERAGGRRLLGMPQTVAR